MSCTMRGLGLLNMPVYSNVFRLRKPTKPYFTGLISKMPGRWTYMKTAAGRLWLRRLALRGRLLLALRFLLLGLPLDLAHLRGRSGSDLFFLHRRRVGRDNGIRFHQDRKSTRLNYSHMSI